MRLSQILSQLDEVVEQRGPLAAEATDVVCDSRQVVPGCVFVALPGTHADGRQFVAAAVAAGAALFPQAQRANIMAKASSTAVSFFIFSFLRAVCFFITVV